MSVCKYCTKLYYIPFVQLKHHEIFVVFSIIFCGEEENEINGLYVWRTYRYH